MKGVSFTTSLYFTLRRNVNAFFSKHSPIIVVRVHYSGVQQALVAEQSVSSDCPD